MPKISDFAKANFDPKRAIIAMNLKLCAANCLCYLSKAYSHII